MQSGATDICFDGASSRNTGAITPASYVSRNAVSNGFNCCRERQPQRGIPESSNRSQAPSAGQCSPFVVMGYVAECANRQDELPLATTSDARSEGDLVIGSVNMRRVVVSFIGGKIRGGKSLYSSFSSSLSGEPLLEWPLPFHLP